MFSRFFKDRNDEDNEDYLVVKICFHCSRDGEYEEDENICRYCGFPI